MGLFPQMKWKIFVFKDRSVTSYEAICWHNRLRAPIIIYNIIGDRTMWANNLIFKPVKVFGP